MSNTTQLFNITSQKKIPTLPTRGFPHIWKNEYYKTYPRFHQIELPPPEIRNTALYDVIYKRRSQRVFIKENIELQTLSTLLYYSVGISRLPDTDISIPMRVYPSAGARYPLEIYTHNLILGKTHHYNVQSHALEELPFFVDKKILKKTLQGINGELLETASLIIFISSVFNRTEIKYGNASFRYICMEGGHVMQNIYLVGETLGLGCCAVGGFIDSEVNALFNFDPSKERMLYIGILGRTGATPNISLHL